MNVGPPVAALASAGDPVARVFARETRTRRRVDLFIHSDPSRNWETERGARRQNSANVAAGVDRSFCRRTRASAAWEESYSGRGERDRHYPRARCLRIDVDERFYNRRPGGDARGCDPRRNTEIYRS